MADLTKAMHVHKKAPFKLRYSSQPEAPIEKVDVNGVPGVFILKNVPLMTAFLLNYYSAKNSTIFTRY